MINEALRLLRVFHDLKQFEMAEKLGISKSHMSEIEKGTKSPSLDLIERYAAEFKVPVSSIMFFAEKIPDAKEGGKVKVKVKVKIATKVLDILKFVERKANA